MERLEKAGIPCAPILTIPEVLAQPQTEALEIFHKVPEMDLELLGLPVSFDGVRPALRKRSPKLGEHNSEIFGETGKHNVSPRLGAAQSHANTMTRRTKT